MDKNSREELFNSIGMANIIKNVRTYGTEKPSWNKFIHLTSNVEMLKNWVYEVQIASSSVLMV